MFGLDKGALKVVKISKRKKNGIYKGTVQYVDKNGKVHTKDSTFFPDSWSRKMVKEEVNTAYYRAMMRGQTSGKVRAKGKRGLTVEMQMRDGVVISAYPIVR